MSSADGKVLVLGVTGSIAAYKAADLTSRLVKEGYEVHVIMTAAANCETLRRRGVEFIEPTEGPLACGVSGKGRFAPAEDILAALRRG